MAPGIADLLTKAGNGTRPVPTTLSSTLPSGAAPGTASCSALTGWNSATAIHFAIYQIDTNGKKIAGSQTDWKGLVSGATITNLQLKAGTNSGYPVGAIVEATPTAAWVDDLIAALLQEHSQTGAHAAVTATSLLVSGALTLNLWDGYITSPDTWVYVSASSFKITGVDRTAQFPVGTKIKLTQTSAKYFYVTSTSFSTDTTVNITAGTDYTLANAAITSPLYSYDATPQGFPSLFNYTPVWTAASSNPSIGNGTLAGTFMMVGKEVFYRIKLVIGSTTTTGTGQWRFSLPISTGAALVPPASSLGASIGTWYGENPGVQGYGGTIIVRVATDAVIGYTNSTSGGQAQAGPTSPGSWANTWYLIGTGSYETT